MNLLNDLYHNSCKPKYNDYKKLSDNILLIDNFFENFEEARNFFINRDTYKCNSYQSNVKPGYESLFPSWIGKSLLEKFVYDNKICIDYFSQDLYDTKCNFLFRDNASAIWSAVHSYTIPHVDGIKPESKICLINLNKISIFTDFYSFEDNSSCDYKSYEKWNNYMISVNKKLLKNNTHITFKDLEEFLDNSIDTSKIKLTHTIEYSPNQAIIYPANLFHCSNMSINFTSEFPRISLRISFNEQTNKNEEEKKWKYV